MDKLSLDLPKSRFFSIDGGDTVVEFKGEECTRWDLWDGPVPTSLWVIGDLRLTELSESEALVRINGKR